MKFHKRVFLAVTGALLCGMLAACGGGNTNNNNTVSTNNNNTTNADTSTVTETTESSTEELDANRRFAETRQIRVTIYDRGNPSGSTPEDNFYTDFIKAGMLEDHNVEVTFVPIPRWTEVEEINNLLAAGNAPDICATYNYPTVQIYANMGGIIDLAPYVENNRAILPHLWDLLGETNIYWNVNPDTGAIWAMESLRFVNKISNTFAREDWLNTLNIPEPTTIEEFEDMLRAFKDNANLLLGSEADKMVPLAMGYDVGFRADHLLGSFVPNDLSDRDAFVLGFDERRLLFPGIKEGTRKLNQWYNEGLIWQNFALYGAGDSTEVNMMRSGFVGAFMGNWDFPYRDADEGIHMSMQNLVGEDAAFIAIEPFQNDAGIHKKFLPGPIDRKLFFPTTNQEPLASMLYLDWISQLENRRFLQIGEEGVTHEVQEDGAVKLIHATGEKTMNSPNNIDYTLTINGLDLGDDDLNLRSIALGYVGVDARFIERAFELSDNQARFQQNVNVGEIVAETGVGAALLEKRHVIFATSIVATPDQFDAIYDAAFQDYLNSGGQAIIDERAQRWEMFFGDSESLPTNH